MATGAGRGDNKPPPAGTVWLIPKSKYGMPIRYIADFTYNDRNGQLIVEDAKGVKTPVYRLKRRMMAEIYNIEIKET